MKKLLLILITLLLAIFVWHRQSPRLHRLASQNNRLVATAAELKARIERAESARQSAEQKSIALRKTPEQPGGASDSSSTQPSEAVSVPLAVAVPPDPERHGGWPEGAGFFYFPKEELTNASYRLLNGDTLTDEAAALLAMSATERGAVEQAFSDLFGQFRRLEIDKMELTGPPDGWITTGNPNAAPGLPFDSALTYHIPDLGDDIEAARKTFSQQLEQAVGPHRAQLVATAADNYVRQNMNDLGKGEHVIGFIWQPEPDGASSLWYGIADALHGGGSFQRVPDDLDSHSQIAYYANLFGVKLPTRN